MGATSRGAEELPQFTSMTTVFSYLLLYIMGHLRDMLRIVRGGKRAPEGYAALTADWEDFYSRRFYSRIQDCWNRPICSAPGARVDVMEREEEEHESGNKSFSMSGASRHCVNLGSYNYLGFGGVDERCTPAVLTLTLTLTLTLDPDPDPDPDPGPGPGPNPNPNLNPNAEPDPNQTWKEWLTQLSLYLPVSPCISLYLAISPYISLYLADLEGVAHSALPISPCLYL